MSTIAYEPSPQHSCGPNQYGHWMGREWDQIGTVRVCSCGRSWVAIKHPDSSVLVRIWRPEGWLARRRREWRQARSEATS